MYYATPESYRRTAEQVNLHRHTLKNRVDTAMGEAHSHDRLDLALA